jgi:hypothetical protein
VEVPSSVPIAHPVVAIPMARVVTGATIASAVALRSSRLRRRRDRVAVKSNRAINRRWASVAIVRSDYHEIGKGPVAMDEVVLLDDAYSGHGGVATAGRRSDPECRKDDKGWTHARLAWCQSLRGSALGWQRRSERRWSNASRA